MKQSQSIVGLLSFISKAIPTGRAFLRRFYESMSHVKKSYYFIKVSESLKADAMMWLQFLSKFNGDCFFNYADWVSSENLELFTDAAGSSQLGCGAYFNGQWAYFKWPVHWEASIFKDITYLELIPIVLAFCCWSKSMTSKRIILWSDNEALTKIINKKSSKNKRVMTLIRYLMLSLLHDNIQVRARHIEGVKTIFVTL